MRALWQRSKSGTVAVVVGAVLVFGPVSAPGQEETFEGTSEVVLIEVPINVMTRSGEPVRDLTADDFRIFDDGREQQIAGLEVVDLETIRPTRQTLTRETERMPAAARRHLLFLFDLSFSTPSSILRAREAAQQFALDALHPTDLAAVATFSLEHGPRLLVTFTPDRAQLARAIDTLGVPELLDRGAVVDPLHFVIEEPVYRENIESLRSSGGGAQNQAVFEHLNVLAMQADRIQRSFERRRITAWSRGLGDMAKALATVPGRKHVVYFSEGFDGSLLLGKDQAVDGESDLERRFREQGVIWMIDNDARFGNTKLLGDVRTMLQKFERADTVIQAVDIGGLRAEGQAAASSSSSGSAARVGAGTDALFYIANETGGELFEDANNLETQLARILDHTSVTYVLSFYPDRLESDGSYHQLKVKADLPRGVRLSYRPGYYAPRAYQDLHPLEKSLLASEAIAVAAPRREVEMRILATPFRATLEQAYVPVIIEATGDSLLHGHDGEVAEIEIYAYVTDERGEVRDFFTQPLRLDLSDPEVRRAFMATGLKYYGHLDLKPGDYLVRVLVRNGDTGRTGVESLELHVPPWESMRPALLPPLFAEPSERWLLVRERRTSQGDRVVYPFTMAGEPYIPAARPEIARGQETEFYVVGYNLGAGELKLDATVRAPEGYEARGEVALVERTDTGVDGFDKVRASFEPGGLERGHYTLEVAVSNLETGAREVSSIPFVVN